MLNARAKVPCDMRIYAYGDFSGVTVDLAITPDQKWKARFDGGYVHLTRKGSVSLRLTPAAFNRLFDLRSE